MSDEAAAPARPLSGRCNCGGVAFVIERLASDRAAACHCQECRRGSGHVWAAVTAPADAVRFASAETLRWWRASDRAERGFCAGCGGFLFWRPTGGETIDVALGLLDGSTGVRLDAHIFIAEKGDYYDIDGLPAHPHGRGGLD